MSSMSITDTPNASVPGAPTGAETAVIAVIGGGPAGLMAAQRLMEAGCAVHVFDAMPSLGRKFLLAGKGGLNLTHSEGADRFAGRYGARRAAIEGLLQDFGPEALRAWARSLGIDTFVGSSGRVFPTDMKAGPLLRAWLRALRHPAAATTPANPHAHGGQALDSHSQDTGGLASGGAQPLGQARQAKPKLTTLTTQPIQPVQFHMRHRWTGWAARQPDQQTAQQIPDQRQHHIPTQLPIQLQHLLFETPQGPLEFAAQAVVLALGGGSWARLGSNGAWVPVLAQHGVAVAPLLPANCGFDVQPPWTEFFSSRFAGQPFKSVALQFTNSQGVSFERKGEFVATATGLEGSLIYAASSLLRDEISHSGHATLHLDLLPGMPQDKVISEVQHPRGSRSLSSHLKSRLNLDGIKMAILHELLPKAALQDPAQLARAIKALPITLAAARPLDEAISSAGGVLFEVLNPDLMCEQLPGVFCAGEMLDWEAPTGGYLLQACFASGYRAAQGVLRQIGLQAIGY